MTWPRGLSFVYTAASALVGARTLRLADGPDEVHELVVARFELSAAAARRRRRGDREADQNQAPHDTGQARRSRL